MIVNQLIIHFFIYRQHLSMLWNKAPNRCPNDFSLWVLKFPLVLRIVTGFISEIGIFIDILGKK